MPNAKTAHSKKLRAKTAREANQRRLDEGGMRISILLYADEAQRFTPLVSRAGGIKKAFLALDLFPNQAKVYVFSNLYPCPHPNPPPRGREPLCGRF